MDKERAKFILQSFRPDGADATDGDFADALAVAAADRDLGAWLAAERAFDAGFARALAAVELPDNLREDILRFLAAGRGDQPQAEDGADSAMIGALAVIEPPAGLRERILAAMETTARDTTPSRGIYRRFAIPLAAAAGVALAFLLTTRDEAPSAPRVAGTRPLPIEVVQAGFIRAYESPQFALDEHREDPREIANHLRSKKLPCPGCLPPGLSGIKSIGCRELIIDGKHGSLVCYAETEIGPVHLMIFYREDIAESLPPESDPEFARDGAWATARWEDQRKVYILLAETDIETLARLFCPTPLAPKPPPAAQGPQHKTQKPE